MSHRVRERPTKRIKIEPTIAEERMHRDDTEDEAMCQQGMSSTGKPKRGQANRRERARTENVNAGFDKLRKLIPTEPVNRKLSKIEILRLSTSYIKHLYNLSRANSCLEADELDLKNPAGRGRHNNNNGQGSSKQRNHVCTFCLMRTKPSGARRSN